MRIFDSKFIQGVIDLYYALLKNDKAKAVYAYEQWGFKDITKEKLAVLNKWANFLYSPLMKDKVQKIQESDSGIYGAKIASEVHKELKNLCGGKPPKEFVFMDRAAVGIGSVFMHLGAEVNWYQIFQNLIQDFDQKKLMKKQQKSLSIVKLFFSNVFLTLDKLVEFELVAHRGFIPEMKRLATIKNLFFIILIAIRNFVDFR